MRARHPTFISLVLLLCSGVTLAAQPAARGPASKLSAPPDHRAAIYLHPAMQHRLLGNMRQMLKSVQGVVQGLAQGNMDRIARAASASGMNMMAVLPATLRSHFPAGFLQLGHASHEAFDRIAQEARTGQRREVILKELSRSLQNCSACHSSYRFVPIR